MKAIYQTSATAIGGRNGKVKTDEYAVMIDTFRPLYLTMQAKALDDGHYPYSWIDHA